MHQKTRCELYTYIHTCARIPSPPPKEEWGASPKISRVLTYNKAKSLLLIWTELDRSPSHLPTRSHHLAEVSS